MPTESLVDFAPYLATLPALRVEGRGRFGVGAGWVPRVTEALDDLHALAIEARATGLSIAITELYLRSGRLSLQVTVNDPAFDAKAAAPSHSPAWADFNRRAQRIARDAEHATAALCEECGAFDPQVRKFGGWMKCRCDDCARKFWNQAERYIAAHPELELQFTVTVDRGWYPIVMRLLERFADVARKARYYGYKVTLIQIRQRLGRLLVQWRVDHAGLPPEEDPDPYSDEPRLSDIDESLRVLVVAAQLEADRTCEICAAPGELVVVGEYLAVLCPACTVRAERKLDHGHD